MNYSLTWIVPLFKKNGLRIVEYDSWQTRGHGDVKPTQFVICHHTGDVDRGTIKPHLKMLANGRVDLAGPLCNLALGENGVFYMVAAGKAYHAGFGAWRGIAGGNESAIGIEAKNNGTNEKWPVIQMQQYARGCAALLKHIGKDQDFVCGHKEYALPRGRKSDPDFDMVAFRHSVADYMPGINV